MWDLAAAVASQLVEVDPETAGWWISLAYALNDSVEKAEAILLRTQAIDPKLALIVLEREESRRPALGFHKIFYKRPSKRAHIGQLAERNASGHLLMTVSAVEC